MKKIGISLYNSETFSTFYDMKNYLTWKNLRISYHPDVSSYKLPKCYLKFSLATKLSCLKETQLAWFPNNAYIRSDFIRSFIS